MSRRRYGRRRRDSLSSVVDDTAHLATRFGPVGALWTGAIGFAVFYVALPTCLMAWVQERRASLKGPASEVLASALDQVVSQRVISPCRWAGIAILLACSAIAIWKYFASTDLDEEDANFLSTVSQLVSYWIRR